MQRRGPGRQRGDERRERASLLLALQKSSAGGDEAVLTLELLRAWSSFHKPWSIPCVLLPVPQAAALGKCLFACAPAERTCHLPSLTWRCSVLLCFVPRQGTALALIKITLQGSFSISNSCASKVVFLTQLERNVETLSQSRARQGFSQPRLPSHNLSRFHNQQEKKAETSNFCLGIEGKVSQAWLDNSVSIVRIWMELFPGGVAKS